MKRSCGIILPIFSLPSPYGIGTLGQAAYDFIDFLKAAGQSWWQMLPLGPTGYGDSPYQSFSTYAGNPYFIDPELLLRDGLLTQEELSSVNWGTVKEMLLTWVLTFPGCGIIGYLMAKLFMWIF